MRAGRLDRRISIQRKSVIVTPSGQQTPMWGALATRWAYVSPVRGDERFSAPQLNSKELTEFGVRWSADIADVSPLDRIQYPAGNSTDVSIYDIVEVHEIGRREGLKIIAQRRDDLREVATLNTGQSVGLLLSLTYASP